ncbi:hypothetical protein TNIN_7391 [Trichonephila inaurata madagascariensis]|uniref:WG repeat-containing protein n=1 Tax=Trichonephila inaurata madagascariensis TaxID=2747483 RepID=A0A8X6WS86_9ARAC|nr:hypothetical protein TNIN_7391 [Trichonephila inaurata madagascariensis]
MMRQRKYLEPVSTFVIRNGEYFYPKDKDQNEVYPIVNNKEKPLVQGYAYTYAKDASGKSKYPHDINGNEIALPKIGMGGWHYAKDENGNAFYPKNKSGEEIVFGDYIRNKDGTFKFPLNREGDPKYDTDKHTNDQVYFIKADGSVNWGVDKNGNQRYAKRANGDEYYPENRELACHHSGSPQYARTIENCNNWYPWPII